MKVVVERAGFLSAVQDLGRKGHRANGVSLGGALDPNALRVANLLVGNDEQAAGIEMTLGTIRLRFSDDRLIAWCGGPFEVRAESDRIVSGRPALIHAEEELVFSRASQRCAGLARYLWWCRHTCDFGKSLDRSTHRFRWDGRARFARC